MGILSGLLSLLYPGKCFCQKCRRNYLFSEIRGICDDCLKGIKLLNVYCKVCGREIYKELYNKDGKEPLCKFCQEEGYQFDQARSVGLYDGLLKELLLEYKYGRKFEYTEILVDLLYKGFKEYYITEKIDFIIPVPIHQKRLEQRGYNQAELLAVALSSKVKVPVACDLSRIKNIPPLFNFDYLQRKSLLKNGFFVPENLYQDYSLLIIDDIFTTGSTTDEIARVLKDIGGARRILVLTVATARTY